MKLGCCLNMLGDSGDLLGQRYIPDLTGAGYDYMELPLAQIMDMSEEEFEALLVKIEKSGIPCECCNNFFPASVRLTGEDADAKKAEAYVQSAMERARRLGAKIIVFGSSGAKNVPEGFDHGRAFEQVVDVLRMVHRYAKPAGICIVIEPLNRKESNIIQNLAEGKALMDAVDRPSVCLLADYYHWKMEDESLEQLKQITADIRHVHFADAYGRCFPEVDKPEYKTFFDALKLGGYQGRVSVEAYADHPEEAIGKAVFLRQYF